MPTYITGNGADVIDASDRNDQIFSNGGNDTIRARRGDDVIYAGDGDDFVDGGAGDDVIYAGTGDDQILGGDGKDTIRAEAGNDTVSGGNGDDSLDGGSGFDSLDGGAGDDRLFGGANEDVITTGSGSDVAYGGSGDDNIVATAGSSGDRLYGDGYESLDDFLQHRPVTTNYGSDAITGGSGNDVIYGDSGTDAAQGGNDFLWGGAGDDTIYGEGGNDFIDGGAGKDTIRGGAGDDTIYGGAGADVLTGGAGRDTFVVAEASQSSLSATDRITDFRRGEDKIDLSQLPELLGRDKLAWGGTTPTAMGVWYTQDHGKTFVFASVNGDKIPDLRIQLDGLYNLAATDFHGVIGSDGPPTLRDDAVTVVEDDPFVPLGGVLANDTGEQDLRVTAVRFGATAGTLGVPLRGQYGSLVLGADGGYTYTLDNDSAAVQSLAPQQIVQDVFTYTAQDAGGTSTASFAVTIVGTNDAPTSAGTSIVTNENGHATGTLPAATDRDGDAVAYSLGAAAAHGTAVVNADGTFGYTPNAGFAGTDSFTFVVSDGYFAGNSEYAVSVTVVATNAAPFVASYGVPAGIVHIPIGPGTSADIAAGLVLQPDGKILMAGQSSTPETAQDFTLVRYNPDGSLDTTFGGGDGIVTTQFTAATVSDIANSVALQPDGKILVAGWSSGPDFAIARYNADGSLDLTFGGGDGLVTTPVGPSFSRDEAQRIVVQADGKIVVVGSTQNAIGFPPPPPNSLLDIAVVRYNADGSLDMTFGGGDGIVTTGIGPGGGSDVAFTTFIQPDGRIVVAGYATFPATGQDFALVRYNTDGALDTTFGGGDGIVTTAVAPSNLADLARAIVQLPDGRFVVAGSVQTVSFGPSDFALARYNADGSLDTTFGSGGVATTPLAPDSGSDQATSMVLLADGKLLVGGWVSGSGTASMFAVVRYNSNGSLDTTFGTNGIVLTNVEPGIQQETATGMAVQADGKIVLGGYALSQTGPHFDFALVRYNADGSLDTTFRAEERVAATEGRPFAYTVPAGRFADPDGDALTLTARQSDGSLLPSWLSFDAATRMLSGTAPAGSADVHVRITASDAGGLSASYGYWIYGNTAPAVVAPSGLVPVNLSPAVNSQESANSTALQADGKILLTGSTSAFSDTAVVRLNTDGSLDLRFGGDGIVAINTSSAFGGDTGRVVLVQPDGRILVASNSGGDIAVSRLNPDGSLDTTFGGGDGIATAAIGPGTDAVSGMVIQADGKIVAVGRTPLPVPPGDNDLLLVRYNADGTLDTTFDGDGIATARVSTNPDDALSVTTQADGKIVVSGYSTLTTDEPSMLVARFNTNGSLDTSFSGDGIATINVGLGSGALPTIPEGGQSVAILPDGRILLVGQAPAAAGGTDVVLLRYQADGTPDPTFGSGGVVTRDFSGGTFLDLAFGVALQGDGRIVVAGTTTTAQSGLDIAVMRFNANGSLDTTFGDGDGLATVGGVTQGLDQGTSVAIQPDGRIVVGGVVTFGLGLQDIAAVRLNPDGSLDTSFGGIGTPVVEANQPFTWSMQRFFVDADADTLTYSLTMSDGASLPVGFNFTGTALNGLPLTGSGDLALRLTATDPSGASATQFFVIDVNDPFPFPPPDDGDTFALNDGFGEARVQGFTAGPASGDVLDLSAITNPTWDDFADIAAATTQVGPDALIDLGNGNTITLVGVAASSLTADDFLL